MYHELHYPTLHWAMNTIIIERGITCNPMNKPLYINMLCVLLHNY